MTDTKNAKAIRQAIQIGNEQAIQDLLNRWHAMRAEEKAQSALNWSEGVGGASGIPLAQTAIALQESLELLREMFVFAYIPRKQTDPWRVWLDDWLTRVKTLTGWDEWEEFEKAEKRDRERQPE